MVTWATSQPWQTSSRQAEFTFQPAELRYRQRRHSRGVLGAPWNTWAGLHHQVCSPGPPDDSRLEAPAGRGIPDPAPPHPTPPHPTRAGSSSLYLWGSRPAWGAY